MKPTISSIKAFTLVELMVVVAIIGILAAVAVPSFKKYQAKSRTTEAMMSLGALYTVEQSAFSEFSTYVTCIGDMGYGNSLAGAKDRLYAVGFGDATGGGASYGNIFAGKTSPQCGEVTSPISNRSYFNANKFIPNTALCTNDCITKEITGGDTAGTNVFTNSTFRAGAAGIVSATGGSSAPADTGGSSAPADTGGTAVDTTMVLSFMEKLGNAIIENAYAVPSTDFTGFSIDAWTIDQNKRLFHHQVGY
ncbi:MAG: prepilin-type N-terminal cleavage/methylation domain-containing protein [Pseudomonadota bacterium]